MENLQCNLMLGKVEATRIAQKFEAKKIDIKKMKAFASLSGNVVLGIDEIGRYKVLGFYCTTFGKNVNFEDKNFIAYENGNIYILDNNQVKQWSPLKDKTPITTVAPVTVQESVTVQEL